MKYLQNLHTHTTYADGKDTPEELILKAIDKGFDSVGFSEHSYMTYSKSFSGPVDKTSEYKEEIKGLKEKYKDKIKIFCGLEVDMFSYPDMSGYDYLIGSAHYFKFGENYVGFDRSADEVERVINTYFNGDGLLYAKEYYKLLSTLPEYGDFDIIGHFDLITKHIDTKDFFDVTSKEYVNAAVEAAECLAGKIPFFEVNTGAVARGYRKTVYPTVEVTKELNHLGFGAVITSDCHNADMLDCSFSDAEELLRYCGFKEIYILTDDGFKGISL